MRRSLFSFIAILLIVIPLLVIISRAEKQPQEISSSQSQAVTKTLSITGSSPMNETTGVSIYSPISIKFSRPLSSDEKRQLSITLSPTVPHSEKWTFDDSVLEVIYNHPLTTSTHYTVSLLFGKQQYIFSFITIDASHISTQDQQKEQAQADHNYGQKVQEITDTFPWNEQLPLQSDTYFVYFDVNQKIFIAKLYPKQSGGQSIDSQVLQMETEIHQKLQGLSPDTAKYQISWQITPES